MRTPLLLGPARRNDDGFVLLETLVAIGLIAVVMAAFTTFFVGAVASTAAQRATQVGTQLANSRMDTIRSLPPSDLSSAVGAIDPNALSGTGTPVAVPSLGITQQINNVSYSATVTMGTCVIPGGATSNASCASAALSTGIGYLRAIVTVTWSGARCSPATCSYVTSTLLSTVDDPVFNLDSSAPPAPMLTNPGAQTAAVGDNVVLAATVTAAPPFKVAITGGSLPAGLFLDTSTGRIFGSPTTVMSSAQVTLTLTDGFGRATTMTFNWTIVPAVTVAPPPAQASVVGTAITALTVTASGGSGSYVWSDPNTTLPPGLSLATVNNQAVISGTPTAPTSNNGVLPQTFPVVLTVKDTAGRTATAPISWTINYPPFAAAVPGPQTSTVGTADTVPLAVTGGSGSFTWSNNATLPAGFTLTAAGVLSGTPTAAGVTSVNLTVTDTKSVKSTNPTVYASQNVAFQLTVYARPTVTAPGNQSYTAGYVLSALQLVTSCPNAPCTYAFNNGPASLAINGSGVLAGTVTSAVQTFSNVTITVTDNAGATATSAAFAITVNAAPTMSNPGNQLTAPGGAASLNVAALVSGGTAPFTYGATNLPTWLSINTTTGAITGTAPAAVTVPNITVKVTDGDGFSATSAAFSWVVAGPPSAPPNLVATNGDGTTVISWSAATDNGAAVTGYSVTLSGGGGSCTTTTATTCSFANLTDGVVYAVTVKATNSYGVGPAATVNAIPFPAVMSAANGMTLWLDGADPTVLFSGTGCTGTLATAGTPIGCWKDKSSQNENFNQTSAAARPAVGSWNALSAANFADTGRILNSINATDTYQTVFVAANLTNPAASSIVDVFGNATNDFNVRVGTGTNRNSPNSNDWSTGATDSGGALNWVNGVQSANAPTPGAVITTDIARSVQSFAASLSNTFLNRGIVGQVGDVITFNKVLTATQRHAVEDYLAHKWAMPIKPSAPVAPSAVSGGNAVTAAWTASATGQVSSYTATASPGGASCTTTTLTCSINGLTNGGAYTVSVTATNDFGTSPAAAVRTQSASQVPAVMSAANGMSLWLDGSDPSVLFGGSACTGAVTTTAVGCWKDKSGANENFSQATAAGQPSVGTWNGRSAINFADTGRILNSADSVGKYQTVFIAANITNAAAPSTLIDLFGQAGNDFNVRIGSNTARPAPNGNDWSGATTVNGLPANWANGAQAVTANQPIAVITTDQAASVQSFAASVSNSFYGRGMVGQVGDVVTFNRILTAAERRSVEEYLTTKWGVILTSRAPSTISASSASATSATVTWTAPSSTGGATVTGYTVRSSGGQTCTTTGTLSCTVAGLTTGTAYTFTVAATNSAGAGPASDASNSVTP